MVNKPARKHAPHRDEGQSIPMSNLKEDTSRISSAESSNGIESPSGAEEMSNRSLLPQNEMAAPAGVAIRKSARARPPLSNIEFQQPCSITDERGYTTIPLTPISPDSNVNTVNSNQGTNTLTGTIRRGHKPVQVHVHLTEQEMKALSRSSFIEDDKQGSCIWGLRKGLHILVLSILYFPFAFLTSLCVCFYVGTMCWYNIYLFLSEENSIWHKIFLCPLLIIFYPFLIVVITLVIAVFAAFKQISWFYSSWLKEIKDFDKGVFGAICGMLKIPQCSPYEVVILDEQLNEPVVSQTSV